MNKLRFNIWSEEEISLPFEKCFSPALLSLEISKESDQELETEDQIFPQPQSSLSVIELNIVFP